MLFVGVCGALSYWAGYKFSAVEFSLSVVGSLVVLTVQWAGVAWLIMRVFVNDYSVSNKNPDTASSRQR